MDILAAIDDPKLFAPWFKRPETWRAWRVWKKVLFGLPGLMTPEDFAIFRACTGLETVPTQPYEESTLIVGRRGGKSFNMALLAVYLACFKSYREYLQPGERAAVIVIAADRKQAKLILRYCRGLLTRIPMLKRMLERESTEEFELTNSTTIEVCTASLRTSRGRSVAAVIADECAFWRTDESSANPDVEVLSGVRAGMANIPGAIMIKASSPYAKRGELWEDYRRYWGKPDAPVLVWKAPTRVMNPSIRESVITKAYDRDPAAASAEFGAEFRSDISTFIDREIVLSLVDTGVYERLPMPGVAYTAFTDPAGGAGGDSFTLAIAHRDHTGVVLDAVKEIRPPFVPERAVDEFAKTLKAYGLSKVTGDRYAGTWPQQAFEARSIRYDFSERNRSEIYIDVLPLMTSGQLTLLDSDRLVNQICGLERKTGRTRDVVDHGPGQHDDLCNAALGVASLLGIDNLSKLWAKARDPQLEAIWK